MKVGIFYHEAQVPPAEAEELARTFISRKADAVCFTSEDEIPCVERLVVLGGDGTVLHAARKAAESGIPLVAVNYGTIGFLTEFERDEAEDVVELVLDKSCRLLRRSMLQVGFRDRTFYCLNELALMRRNALDAQNGLIRILVTIDGSHAGEFIADGLIVSTPTGSTAYSRSAGGSIMTPDCETFLLTPVCPLSLKSRPIACPDKSALSFSVPKGVAVVLHGDGNCFGEARCGDTITVKKAERAAIFLTKGKQDFFRRLTEKIN